MIKVKDGYAKLIGTTYLGSANRVLLSNGGDIEKAVASTANTLVLRDSSGLITSSGFVRLNSSNDYVLLGGGSHCKLSGLDTLIWTSYTTYYLDGDIKKFYWYKIPRPTNKNNYQIYDIQIISDTNYPSISYYKLWVSCYSSDESTNVYLQNLGRGGQAAYTTTDLYSHLYVCSDSEGNVYILGVGVFISNMRIKVLNGTPISTTSVGYDTPGVANGFTPDTPIYKDSIAYKGKGTVYDLTKYPHIVTNIHGDVFRNDGKPLILEGSSGIYFQIDGSGKNSLVLKSGCFKPFDGSSNKLNLGTSAARWLGIYGNSLDLSAGFTARANSTISSVNHTPLKIESTGSLEASIVYKGTGNTQWIAGTSTKNIADTFGIWSTTLGNNVITCYSSGDVKITGKTTATNFVSTVATGTQPYACSSTTLNTNLNADMLDGVHLAGYGGKAGVMRSWSRGTYTTVKLYFGNGNIVVIDPKPTDDSTLSPNTIIFSLGDSSIRNTLLAFMYERDEIKYRRAVDGPTWRSWRTIAFTDSDISGTAAYANVLKSNSTTSVPRGLLFYTGWLPQGNTNNRSWCSPTGNNSNNSVKGEYGSIIRVNYNEYYYNELFFDANSGRPTWRKITGTNSTGWKTLGLQEDIRPSGFVTSDVAGLSSYWGKLWEATHVANYNDVDITFYIHSAHNLKRGFVHIRVRRNPVTTDGVTTYIHDVNLVLISGNIPTSEIRLYHDATSGKMELWLDVKVRWGVYNANVVSCTQRFGNEVIPIVGTLFSNNFTTVLTLPTYSYITLSNLNSNQVHVLLHTGNNTEYPLVWSNLTNTNNITTDLLYKSYSHLTYNPGLQRISVLKVHSTGQLLLSAATEVALRYGNTDATSVVLANEEFRPYTVANSKINLGNSSVRWKGLYALTGNFSGDVLVSGALKIGSNSTRNYIAFRGTTADGDGGFNHTYIGENIYNSTEASELVLFKGNDPASNAANPNGTGPDRIRYIAAGHLFQIYRSPIGGTFESVCTSTTPVNTLALNQANVTSYVELLPSANNTLNLGSSSLKWANIYSTKFIGALLGNADTATNADKLDGYHASSFVTVTNRQLIYTTGTAPYAYVYLFRIANTSGYSTTRCDFDIKLRDNRIKFFIDIVAKQYPYGSSDNYGTSISIYKETKTGNNLSIYYIPTIADSGYNYYDVYCKMGAWQGGQFDLVSSGGSGTLFYEIKKIYLDSLPSGAIEVGDCYYNKASVASKLATARTISLTGSVTGSGSFDGSSNLSISTTTNHTHSYLPLSGGTMTGSVTFANKTWNVVGDDAAIGDYNAGGMLGLKSINNDIPGIGFHNSSNTLLGRLQAKGNNLYWNDNLIIHGGNSSVSDYTVKINNTTKNFVRDWGSGAADMNAVARGGRSSMGMANLIIPEGTATAVNPNGLTGWHHFINMSFDDGGGGSNAWITQIANKAGSTDLWVRSRYGGTIDNTVAWVAGWTRILTGSNYTSVLDGNYVKAYKTLTNTYNIDDDWGLSVVTFDPKALGTYPSSGNLANFTLLNLGNNFSRRKQFGFDWRTDSIFYRRHVDSWTSWVTLLHSGNYSNFLDSRYYTETEVNNKLSGYLPLAGGTMTGIINTCSSQGSWIVGKTEAAIKFNSLKAIDSNYFWRFYNMKSASGNVVCYGGLGDNIGFHGYYSATTANLTDWRFTVNTANGNWTATGSIYAAHFYEHSDINLKTNIKPILTSDNIPLLKSFDWKSDGSHSYGLIAQELEELGYSELVSDEGGLKTVKYSAALSLIVGKLQVKIKELEKEIENLKNKN